MGSSEPRFHGSSRVRDHPSHTKVTLCPWLSGCDGKGVHCPGRGAHLGSTTLSCFESPQRLRSLIQPKLVHGPHSLALSYAPPPWKQTPKPPSAPWGQQTPSPLQSRLLSKGTGGRGHTAGSRAGDQGTPKPTRVRPTASLHLVLGAAKEALPPAKGPPGGLSVSQRPRKASPSPAKLSRPTKHYPSGMTVFLTVTGKEQSSLLAALPFPVLTAHTQHGQGWLPQSLFSIFKWL